MKHRLLLIFHTILLATTSLTLTDGSSDSGNARPVDLTSLATAWPAFVLNSVRSLESLADFIDQYPSLHNTLSEVMLDDLLAQTLFAGPLSFAHQELDVRSVDAMVPTEHTSEDQSDIAELMRTSPSLHRYATKNMDALQGVFRILRANNSLHQLDFESARAEAIRAIDLHRWRFLETLLKLEAAVFDEWLRRWEPQRSFCIEAMIRILARRDQFNMHGTQDMTDGGWRRRELANAVPVTQENRMIPYRFHQPNMAIPRSPSPPQGPELGPAEQDAATRILRQWQNAQSPEDQLRRAFQRWKDPDAPVFDSEDGVSRSPLPEAGASRSPLPEDGASRSPLPEDGASRSPRPEGGVQSPVPAPTIGDPPKPEPKESDEPARAYGSGILVGVLAAVLTVFVIGTVALYLYYRHRIKKLESEEVAAEVVEVEVLPEPELTRVGQPSWGPYGVWNSLSTRRADQLTTLSDVGSRNVWRQSVVTAPPEPLPVFPIVKSKYIDHSDWAFLRMVGRGTYGSVFTCVNNRTGGIFATKLIFVDERDSQSVREQEQMMNEVEVLSKLQHENIVDYFGSVRSGPYFYLFLEYVSGGSLRSVLSNIQGRLHISLVQSYARHILQGLTFLHQNGVVHRDLKPGNVLISVDGVAKLADFGTAYDMKHLTHTVAQTICGTPVFMAPEIMKSEGHTSASDIWSFGGTFFEMLAGNVPFASYESKRLMYELRLGALALEWPPDVHVPAIARDLVEACMSYTPQSRILAPLALDHEFFRSTTILPSLPSDQETEIQCYLSRRSNDGGPVTLHGLTTVEEVEYRSAGGPW